MICPNHHLVTSVSIGQLSLLESVLCSDNIHLIPHWKVPLLDFLSQVAFEAQLGRCP